MSRLATTSSTARPRPLLAARTPLVGVLVVVAVLVALLGACGDSTGGGEPTATATVTTTAEPSSSPTPSVAPTPTERGTLYFLRDGTLFAVEHDLEAKSDGWLKALLKGPNAKDKSAGVTTAIPSGVRIVQLITGAGGNATVVDLSAAFARPDTASLIEARMAQLVYTATAAGPVPPAPSVRRVILRINGVYVDGLPSVEGDVEWRPRRNGYAEKLPPIFVEQPGLGAEISSPFVLAGTASVYEGSFTARLLDDDGRRLASATVQATRGAPGRGRFRETITYSTTATEGTLQLYSLSMEDGSRQNEVNIPVTFAH